MELNASPGEPPRSGPSRWARVGGLVVAVIAAIALASSLWGWFTTSEPVSNDELDRMRAEFDRQIPDGLDAQRRAMHDGTVDIAELRELAAHASDCSLMAGSRPISIGLSSTGGLTRTIRFDPDGDNVDELMAISDRCWEHHVGLAELRYSDQR